MKKKMDFERKNIAPKRINRLRNSDIKKEKKKKRSEREREREREGERGEIEKERKIVS